MCPPQFYGVEYVINPWMEGNIGRAKPEVARRQWNALRTALARRTRIELIDPVPGLPDMPFTANAGLVHQDIFIPSRFRFLQRQPEVDYVTEWFRHRGYRIIDLPGQGTFEGEGDALFQPGEPLVWGGYGVRTALDVHRYLTEILQAEVVPLRLIDERFYHLDTCFCPLPGGRVIYYPEAFDPESVGIITARFPAEKRYAVSRSDALQFACNAAIVDHSFITNFVGEALRAQLCAWGYDAVVCPLSEFILAGGAAKCLVLQLAHDVGAQTQLRRFVSSVCERLVEVQGDLLDRALMNQLLDCITDSGGSFHIESFQAGLRHDQASWARLRVVAPSPERLECLMPRLIRLGARVVGPDVDAHLQAVTDAGVAPPDFYSTTIFPTEVRLRGVWIRAEHQRMDAVLVVSGVPERPRVICRLLRDLVAGDHVVCGSAGVRVHPTAAETGRDVFGFMSAGVSSERRVELMVERVAAEMRRLRARDGRIVVVAGPVVIHTGGGPHLAALIRRDYVQALLGGNGLAAHDIEQNLFGTSLGVDLKRGVALPGGHQHHLRAINLVRAYGGIANAVRHGALRGGIMYECVQREVPFALAGSIRDDGPLPETIMDLIAAQEAYARLLEGADMILMLASMLHSIGVGNMTPAGVRLICVDISPAVVTKLADRGSIESTGIVTDVGLFLRLLEDALAAPGRARALRGPSAGHERNALPRPGL